MLLIWHEASGIDLVVMDYSDQSIKMVKRSKYKLW